MLTDPVEIDIISKAKQKNVRNPQRSRVHFDNIFAHFLKGQDFENRVFLDMGPGQYDFGVLVRERGGDVVAIDNDPAVIALGEHKGFRCLEADLRVLASLDIPRPLDGIFCKFSISAFWFDEDAHEKLVETFRALLTPEGWLWISPWNGPTEDTNQNDIEAALRCQIDAFTAKGFDAWELSDVAVRYFGVSGAVSNHVLFTRGLRIPDDEGLLRPITSDTPFGTGAAWPEAKSAPKLQASRPGRAKSSKSSGARGVLKKLKAIFGRT